MKINIRHEAATAADDPPGSEATEERTCVWIVGDEGETQDTSYFGVGETVAVDVVSKSETITIAELGEVQSIVQPPPA